MTAPPQSNNSPAIELAAAPGVLANRRKQRRKLGNPETAEDAAKQNRPQASNKSCLQTENAAQSAKPSNLASDNSKRSPPEPPCVPEGDSEKQKETEDDNYADVDLGWQWLHNPNDPVWVKENEAMNKLIDDLDDMFMTYVPDTQKR